MEHAVPSENFQRENGTTFSEVPLFPEIFQWNKPKNHVPFTTQPEFPESLGKWKTPFVAVFWAIFLVIKAKQDQISHFFRLMYRVNDFLADFMRRLKSSDR